MEVAAAGNRQLPPELAPVEISQKSLPGNPQPPPLRVGHSQSGKLIRLAGQSRNGQVTAAGPTSPQAHSHPHLIDNKTHTSYEYNQSRAGSEEIQSTRSFTSFHLASMLSLHSKITKNSYYLPPMKRVVLAARQGPALGVTPVLIPSHPCHSILFVFSHFCHPFSIAPSLSWK